MILQFFKRQKELNFEHSYDAPVDVVWRAWTRAEELRQWWGPDKTTVPVCEIDLRIGGEIHVVTEAGEAMGKYQGTRWPMLGTFTRIDEQKQLAYDARSWTDGDEEGTTICHTNDVTLSSDGGSTTVHLHMTITEVGPKAKMAAFAMKWGYKEQLDELEQFIAAS